MRALLFGIWMLLAASPPVEAEVVVIANKSVPARSIDRSALFDIYSGDIKRWGDGQPVVLTDLEARGETRESFYRFLGKNSTRMKSIWMKNMLSGEGNPPEALDTEDEVLDRVASTPGAIGYVSRGTFERARDQVITLVVIPDAPGGK